MCQYNLQINGPLFRQQRVLLLDLAARWDRDTAWLPDKEQRRSLEGVINLLDEIADQAHDVHGIDCLLEEPLDEQR
jgi:hypothetical protein